MNAFLPQMLHWNQHFPSNRNQHSDFNRFSYESYFAQKAFEEKDFENIPKDFGACSIVINSSNS